MNNIIFTALVLFMILILLVGLWVLFYMIAANDNPIKEIKNEKDKENNKKDILS